MDDQIRLLDGSAIHCFFIVWERNLSECTMRQLLPSLVRSVERFWLFITCGLLSLAGACNTSAMSDIEPDPTAPVQTSQLSYRLSDNNIGDYELRVPWTMTNAAPVPIYNERCGSRLEKWVADAWVLAYSAPCPLAAPPIDTIPPGAQFSNEFLIYACYEQNCAPSFQIEPIPGRYRLVIGLYYNAVYLSGVVRPQDPLPTVARRSNAFWLDLP